MASSNGTRPAGSNATTTVPSTIADVILGGDNNRGTNLTLADLLEIRNYTDRATGLNCSWIASRHVCPEGRFCPTGSADASYPCPTGFWCPYDTAHPVYCCPGFYCASPNRIAVCPEGSYCPRGSNRPFPCHFFLAQCKPGTAVPTRVGVFVVFGAFAVVALLAFILRAKRQKRARLQRALQLDLTAAPTPVLNFFPLSTSSDAAEDGSERVSAAPNLRQRAGFSDESTSASTAIELDTLGAGPRKNTGLLDTGGQVIADVTRAEVPAVHFHVRFEGITKTLNNGATILRDVSGELRPGKLAGILGGSGSGKSSFLNTLAGKTRRTGGTVYLNDVEDEMARYAKLIGFVPQEDIMLRDLTVRDILRHSAHMRLPAALPTPEKDRRVKELMAYLGLLGVADSIIGDERVRGISGGQRKRVNIGMELVAEPSILLLDEPTSGLDSSTSLELCSLLKRIAVEKGLVVAAVVHSPSQQCFELFDDVTLLGTGGRVVYTGARRYALEYLRNLGFVKPASQSEPEFFLDVVTGKVPLAWNPQFRAHDLFDYWDAFRRGAAISDNHTPGNASMRSVAAEISTLARSHPANAKRRSLSNRLLDNVADVFRDLADYARDVADETAHTLKTLGVPDPVRATPGPAHTLLLCMRRAAVQIWRSWGSFMSELGVHLAAGAFISLASQDNEYLGRYPDALCDVTPFPMQPACRTPLNLLPQTGVFVSLGVLFAGISVGASTFGGAERVVYWRDVAAGMPTVPYFVAKALVDVPRIVLAGVTFSLSLVFLWPYRGLWVSICAVVVALYFAAFSMGYFISTAVHAPQAVGLVATAFALLWALVLGGLVPPLGEVEREGSGYYPFRFLWSLSAPRYAVEALFIEEAGARAWDELTQGTAVYDALGYRKDGYGAAVLNIVVIGLLWQTAALVGLKLANRERQK
ncbi:hypothetical protein H9P43_005295 [Blastocladiella emersonii ATCC 22665]|nr:hypothetical protein H9P43_005295 [Blastocladiella emersonii ATCC 22665]